MLKIVFFVEISLANCFFTLSFRRVTSDAHGIIEKDFLREDINIVELKPVFG